MSDGYKVKIEGDNLVITIPAGKAAVAAAGLTKNENSKLVASTRGTARIEGPHGVMFNLGLNLTCAK